MEFFSAAIRCKNGSKRVRLRCRPEAALLEVGGQDVGARHRIAMMVDAADPFDLQRFVRAQSPVFAAVLSELDAGRKRTHWMWFVFPQLRGLGHSPMAKRYGIRSLLEARAYCAHSVLGPRLLLCTQRVLAVDGSSLHEIFGVPDDAKFASSMTLFARAAGDGESPFRLALERFCGGSDDDRTLAILEADEKARGGSD